MKELVVRKTKHGKYFFKGKEKERKCLKERKKER